MALDAQTIEGKANERFEVWTAEKMQQEFENNNLQLHGIVVDYINLTLFEDGKKLPFYLSNDHVRDHVEGHDLFERSLDSSLQLGACIYSHQIRIHRQVIRQWKRYQADSEWREELDAELKAATNGKIVSVQFVFESGMKFSVFLRHKKRI